MVSSYCAVSGCKKECYPGCGLTFHRLPSKTETRNKWFTAVGATLTKSSVICSLHFKTEDYLTQAYKKLKPEAIPSIFPENFPANAEQVSNVIQIAESENDDECTEPEPSQEPPNKKLKLNTDISTQTVPTATPREKELKREVRRMRMQIRRRDLKISNMKTLLRILVQKCNYEEVDSVLKNNLALFIDN